MTFSLCVHNGFYFFWIQPSPFGTYAKALGMTQDDFGSCHQFWIDLENGTCFQPTQVLPRGLIGGVNRSRYASLRVATSRFELSRFELLVVTSRTAQTGEVGLGSRTQLTQLILHRFIRFIRFMFDWRIGGNLVAGIGGKRRLEYIGILCRFCKNAGLKSLKMSRTWVCPGALPRNVSTSIRRSAAWCARCLPRCLSCRSPLCSRTLAFEFRWRTLGEASCFHDLGETFWR